MKIKLTSVYVDDQDKALRFYTEVLGFAKKADVSQGPYRWLTVASPEEPDGTELQLALNDNPAAKAYQQAIFQQGQPAAMFYTDDVKGDYERIKARGAEFTMPPTDVTGSTIAMLNDTCGNLNHFRRWMPGWLRSVGSGPLTWMLSNATSTTWISQHQRKGRQGEDDRSRAVHTGSGQRGAGTKGRREVDAHSRQRTAPLAGKSLAGPYRPGASARVGALRRRWEPGCGWNHGEAHHGGSAHAARLRNNSDASRRSQGA